MKKLLIITLLILLPFLIGGAVVHSQDRSNDLNKIFGIMGDKWTGEYEGLNCGVPSSKQNKCCYQKLKKKEIEEIQTRSVERVPEFFCLPPGLTQIAQAGGGILGDLTDIFTAPIDAAASLVSGDLGGVLDAGKSFILPDGVIGAVEDIGSGGKVCLSDAPKLLIATTIGIVPLNRAANLDLPLQPCIEGGVPTKKNFSDKDCRCIPDPTGFAQICNQYVRDPQENKSCLACVSKRGAWTGLGCIGTDMPGFVGSVMRIGVGVAGGVALLCILYAAFLFQVSRGNPENLKKAREYMTSCITGLLLIIFSVFILRIIGVDILGLPGFR